jgi:hypothetical protein
MKMKITPLYRLKEAVKMFLPPIVMVFYHKIKRQAKNNKPENVVSIEDERREHFKKIVSNVDSFIDQFRSIPDNLIYDETFMEQFIIEKI